MPEAEWVKYTCQIQCGPVFYMPSYNTGLYIVAPSFNHAILQIKYRARGPEGPEALT